MRMRNQFGWDLPPGVTNRMIDEAYGEERHCPKCDEQMEYVEGDEPHWECPDCGYVEVEE